MKIIKSLIIAVVISAATINLTQAQTRFHVSVNAPGVHVSAGNYSPYYHRAYYEPVYYTSYERAYYPAHRVYYAPAPRHHYVVYRRPVYHRVSYSRHYDRGHYYGRTVSHHAHYRH